MASANSAVTSKETKQESEYDSSWLKGTSAEKDMTQVKKNDFSNPIFSKLSRINGKINTMNMDELKKSLEEVQLETNGKKEILIKRLKNFHKQTNLRSQNIKEGNKSSSFDYVCVIDFEATCVESVQNDYPHEIIEFPIVLINMKTLQIEDCFSSYCKPSINPKLTSYCTELTGITQDKVDMADDFAMVLAKVEKWFDSFGLGTKYRFAVATDGPWDMQKFLNLQCFHSQLLYPHWAKKWIDIRKLFSNWSGARRCGIRKMLSFYDLEFEGRPHCGLDDAKNIARILLALAMDGCKIHVNDRIKKSLTNLQKKPQTINQTSLSSSEEEDKK